MFQVIAAIAAILALHATQIEAQSLLATDCYFKSDNSVKINGIGTANPCGVVTPTTNFISCCVVGDTCLQDGICHYTHTKPNPPANETGYYMGGCTDKTFSAPACSPQCTDQDLPDIVYNEEANIWHCCGVTNGSVRCDIPSDETFTAPAKNLLSETFTVGSTPTTAAAAASTTSSTITTTTSATSGASTTPGGTVSSGLSGGAKAGIGIGCAVVALAGLGVLIWFCARRRNMRAMEKGQEAPFVGYPQSYPQKTEVPMGLSQRENWQKTQVPVELGDREPRQKRDTIRAELG